MFNFLKCSVDVSTFSLFWYISCAQQDLHQELKHIKGLHRKLAAARQKDPETRKLEIEQEIELQERMLEGEFIWTPGADELVLKERND